MNYYPNNFYQNYPYQNYLQYGVLPQPAQQNFSMSIPGKVVDSIDIVKATDIPLGSYGIFPKGDFSEIYIKSWNENGTSKIMSYQLISDNNDLNKQEEINNILLDKIENIDTKLIEIFNKINNSATQLNNVTPLNSIPSPHNNNNNNIRRESITNVY